MELQPLICAPERRDVMTKVISMINLKGGVGKTTTTLAIAEFLSHVHKKKVLVIDLDPQTNATVALIGEKKWKEKNELGQTVCQMFKDKLDQTSRFKISTAIEKNVSNLGGGIEGLDLLPSSIELIEIQDAISKISDQEFNLTSPVMILREHVENIKNQYDFLLIDCPPNLGLITLNGIFISDYYLIPTIPDILSTYGIPQILTRINQFKQKAHSKIEPMGIIINLYRSNLGLHNTTINDLQADVNVGRYPKLLKPYVPYSGKLASAADNTETPNTLRQKYGYTGPYETYEELTKGIIDNAK